MAAQTNSENVCTQAAIFIDDLFNIGVDQRTHDEIRSDYNSGDREVLEALGHYVGILVLRDEPCKSGE